MLTHLIPQVQSLKATQWKARTTLASKDMLSFSLELQVKILVHLIIILMFLRNSIVFQIIFSIINSYNVQVSWFSHTWTTPVIATACSTLLGAVFIHYGLVLQFPGDYWCRSLFYLLTVCLYTSGKIIYSDPLPIFLSFKNILFIENFQKLY